MGCIVEISYERQVEFMTCGSNISRPVCALLDGSVSSPTLITATFDRIVYCSLHHSDSVTVLTKPFLPLEPLVLGLLERFKHTGGIESVEMEQARMEERLRSIVLRYSSRFEKAVNNEGLTADSGITLTVVNALAHHGFNELALFVAKSDTSINSFRQVIPSPC